MQKMVGLAVFGVGVVRMDEQGRRDHSKTAMYDPENHEDNDF